MSDADRELRRGSDVLRDRVRPRPVPELAGHPSNHEHRGAREESSASPTSRPRCGNRSAGRRGRAPRPAPLLDAVGAVEMERVSARVQFSLRAPRARRDDHRARRSQQQVRRRWREHIGIEAPIVVQGRAAASRQRTGSVVTACRRRGANDAVRAAARHRDRQRRHARQAEDLARVLSPRTRLRAERVVQDLHDGAPEQRLVTPSSPSGSLGRHLEPRAKRGTCRLVAKAIESWSKATRSCASWRAASFPECRRRRPRARRRRPRRAASISLSASTSRASDSSRK